MFRFAAHGIAASIVLTLTPCVFSGAVETTPGTLTIFQTNLFRNARPYDWEFRRRSAQLSTRWTLGDYFGDFIEDVCECTCVKCPTRQQYWELEERSAAPENQFVDIDHWRRYVDGGFEHANWVDSFSHRDAFIASKAPMKYGDVFKFWSMVWQNNVHVIAMLTPPEDENGNDITFQYWPKFLNAGKIYAGYNTDGLYSYYEVYLAAREVDRDSGYECLRLFLKMDFHFYKVTLCVFTEWPDMSVPRSTDGFIAFRNRVKVLAAEVNTVAPLSPVLVHCRMGRGRTGTYIAIDVLIERMESQPQMPVDVAAVVERLRIQRPRSVLTEAQYNFCVTALRAHYCASREYTWKMLGVL